MRIGAGSLVLVLAMTLGSRAFGQAAPPDVTDAEFLCMSLTADAAGKLVYGRTKCAIRCVKSVWRGSGPATDCVPPYAGKTALCMTRAAGRFARKVRKACDPAIKATRDCPECYAGGDCSETGYQASAAALLASESDSFIAATLCERAGATSLEQRCQQITAKMVAKLYGARLECYERCFNLARDGSPASAECLPPPTHLQTQACLAQVAVPYLDDMADACGPGAVPDGCVDAYPTVAAWDALNEVWVAGDVVGSYCAE